MDVTAEVKQRLEELWRSHLPLTLSRVEVLQQAIEALPTGLPNELRIRARDEAHKLAGSLGTFDLTSASDCAARIERLFLQECAITPEQIATIEEDFRHLKSAIEKR